MSLLYNDYWKIKQDNADAIAEISGKNQGAVLRMFRYIASFHVSMFEMEVVKKDIIGIALEADAEDMAIEDKIGCSEKEFCDGLVQEGMSHNWQEYLFVMIRNFIYWLFFMNTMEFILIAGFSDKWGITNYSFTVSVLFSVSYTYFVNYRRRKVLYQKGKKKLKGNMMYIMLCLSAYFISTLLPQHTKLIHFYGHGRLVWGILLVCTVATFLLNNYYWNQCSKCYDWK